MEIRNQSDKNPKSIRLFIIDSVFANWTNTIKHYAWHVFMVKSVISAIGQTITSGVTKLTCFIFEKKNVSPPRGVKSGLSSLQLAPKISW